MPLKIALPKGRLMAQTAELLDRAGWGMGGYHSRARLYRLQSERFANLSAKIFHEKDIPIQVAIGNYDMGICGLDWINELLTKYPKSALVRVKNLGYGGGGLYAATAGNINLKDIDNLSDEGGNVRIASEYPNLAEALAEELRLRRFSIYPLWGAAEAYPPENAELVLISRKNPGELMEHGLKPVKKMLDFRAYLVANEDSLKVKDMAEVVASIVDNLMINKEAIDDTSQEIAEEAIKYEFQKITDDTVRVALPDGHQQPHVRRIFDAAGIEMNDYPSDTGNRRPVSQNLKGYFFKLIRPQDMPLQVANGNFDIAITGRDWLKEHLYQFPQSPVVEMLDLKYGWVKIVAVIDQEVPVENAGDLKDYCNGKRIRVATEYINIADNYARENHLGRYLIVPTWGATEAFLPEDADMMIENTETGGTIKRHNLKIIDTLFESTACVVANKSSASHKLKEKKIKEFIGLLSKALQSG